jgi:electron transport complex protein RnfD
MALLSIYHYGVMALTAILSAAFFVLLPTYIALKLKKRRLADIDNENYYYALLFALTLPAGAPFYIIVTGALILNLLVFTPGGACALRIINPIALVSCFLVMIYNEKMNFFNGPRAFMSGAWFSPFPSHDYSGSLLFYIHNDEFNTAGESLKRIIDILSSWNPGHYGELSIVLMAGAFIFLSFKKCVDSAPLIGSVAGLCAGVSVLYYSQGFNFVLIEIISHAFASMFLFYSCFVLTDYYSSPRKYSARLIYGLAFGLLFSFLSFYSDGPDCSNFSLAIASACVPLIDNIFNRGGRRA